MNVRIDRHQTCHTGTEQGTAATILPKQTQGIIAACFANFKVIAVSWQQSSLIGHQVNTQDVGGGRRKTQPKAQIPGCAGRYIALHGQHRSTRCRGVELQFPGRIHDKIGCGALPARVLVKISIGKIVHDLGIGGKRKGADGAGKQEAENVHVSVRVCTSGLEALSFPFSTRFLKCTDVQFSASPTFMPMFFIHLPTLEKKLLVHQL